LFGSFVPILILFGSFHLLAILIGSIAFFLAFVRFIWFLDSFNRFLCFLVHFNRLIWQEKSFFMSFGLVAQVLVSSWMKEHWSNSRKVSIHIPTQVDSISCLWNISILLPKSNNKTQFRKMCEKQHTFFLRPILLFITAHATCNHSPWSSGNLNWK